MFCEGCGENVGTADVVDGGHETVVPEHDVSCGGNGCSMSCPVPVLTLCGPVVPVTEDTERRMREGHMSPVDFGVDVPF